MATPSLDHSTSTRGGGQGGSRSSDEGTGGATASSVGQLGEGVAARKEEEKTAMTSPFDRLPDELVSHILSFAFCTRDLTSSAMVSKRVYRLAFPICAESLSPRWQRQATVLQRVNSRPEVARLVRSFKGVLPIEVDSIPNDCAALCSFVNLRTVKLEIDYLLEEDLVTLPHTFTDALRSMVSLRQFELSLVSPVVLEDKTFTIGKDLPHLQHLKLYSVADTSFSSQLLAAPCPNLVSLEIDDASPAFAYGSIP
ncbi:hypothetical protein JCM6882_007714 [Rhodosporidiobolus microsporus]